MFASPREVDRDALRKRSAECVVTERLFKHASPPEGAIAYLADVVPMEDVMDGLSNIL